ncbi:hypothetical protein ACM66B_000222 [Microbotryomycetes sp. NB124-2]
MSRDEPPGTFADAVTPLLSSRTIRSAADAVHHTIASSRPALRSIEHAATAPFSVGRSSGLAARRDTLSLNNVGASTTADSSRLPVRRTNLTTPSTGSKSLKRSSDAAGFDFDHDVAALRRQLTRALQEVEDQKRLRQRQATEFDLRATKLLETVEEQNSKIDRLESHRATLIAKDKGANEGRQAAQHNIDAVRAETQAELKKLRQALSTLQQDYDESKRANRQAVHQIERAKASEQTHASQVAELEEQLASLRQMLHQRNEQLGAEQQRREAAEHAAEQAKYETASQSQDGIIQEELHRQVAHLRTLELDNAKLRRRVETYERQHANIDVLKETNRTLEKKLKALEELRSVNAEQQATIEQLEMQKAEWTVFLRSQADAALSSPREVTKLLASLQVENALQQDTLSRHASELQRRDHLIAEVEQQVTHLQDVVRGQQTKLDRAKEQSERSEKQLALLTREIEMLRRHLDSYSAEEAIHHANFDTQKTARISELEDLLEAHKHELAEVTKQAKQLEGLVERYGGSTTEILNEDTDVHRNTVAQQLKLNEELRQELGELRLANAALETELDALDAQIAKHEQDHGIRGAYNSATTRVLEFRDSPDRVEHAVRSATLERLRLENDALLQRLKDLDTSLGPKDDGAGLVPRASLESVQAELIAARAAVVQKETMLRRISQAVAEKTESMRIAISQLLGYQLAFLESGRIRVTSVYAPSKDRSLAFDPWPGGPMPYKLVSAADDQVLRSADARQSVQFWLESRTSLPGFLASLTMTLYEETTRGAARGVVIG